MKSFKNIVFVSEPDNFDSVAFKQAVALAQSNQAKLTIIGYFDYSKSLRNDQTEVNTLIREMLDHKLDELNKFVKPYIKGLETEVKVSYGKPFIDIIQEVLKYKRDLLIKPIEKSRYVRNVLFSSLDFKLLRKCPCPVWLIKSKEQKGYKEIVVALDYEPDNPENDAINTQLLSMAVSLALSEFSELHVVHAWELEHESFLRSHRMQNTKEKVDAMVIEEEVKRKKWLNNKINSCTSFQDNTTSHYLDPQIHMIQGNPVIVIPDLISSLGSELIIMGTVGRSGIHGYLIGNTAESILNRIDCSVLAVKPKGFKCPISLN